MKPGPRAAFCLVWSLHECIITKTSTNTKSQSTNAQSCLSYRSIPLPLLPKATTLTSEFMKLLPARRSAGIHSTRWLRGGGGSSQETDSHQTGPSPGPHGLPSCPSHGWPHHPHRPRHLPRKGRRPHLLSQRPAPNRGAGPRKAAVLPPSPGGQS